MTPPPSAPRAFVNPTPRQFTREEVVALCVQAAREFTCVRETECAEQVAERIVPPDVVRRRIRTHITEPWAVECISSDPNDPQFRVFSSMETEKVHRDSMNLGRVLSNFATWNDMVHVAHDLLDLAASPTEPTPPAPLPVPRRAELSDEAWREVECAYIAAAGTRIDWLKAAIAQYQSFAALNGGQP